MAVPAFSRMTTLLLRIFFIVALTIGIMIVVLKLLERSGDPLRQGIESYLAQTTHSQVYVRSLTRPRFFPTIDLTIEDVIFSDPQDVEKKRATAERIEFAIPFLNMMIGRQAFEKLALTNLVIEKDVLWPRQLHVEKAAVIPGGPARLQAKGAYGAAPFLFQLDLEQRGDNPVLYTLPNHTPFLLTTGTITARGMFDSGAEGVMLKDVMLEETGGAGNKSYGPQSFFIVQNQQFIKNNPVSCLMDQAQDLKLTDTHPCATLFRQNTPAEGQE